jgi:hypothetical protein
MLRWCSVVSAPFRRGSVPVRAAWSGAWPVCRDGGRSPLSTVANNVDLCCGRGRAVDHPCRGMRAKRRPTAGQGEDLVATGDGDPTPPDERTVHRPTRRVHHRYPGRPRRSPGRTTHPARDPTGRAPAHAASEVQPRRCQRHRSHRRAKRTPGDHATTTDTSHPVIQPPPMELPERSPHPAAHCHADVRASSLAGRQRRCRVVGGSWLSTGYGVGPARLRTRSCSTS